MLLKKTLALSTNHGILKTCHSTLLFGQLFKKISFTSKNYTKFYNLTPTEILENFDQITEEPIKDIAYTKERLLLLNHTREKLKSLSPDGDFKENTQSYFRLCKEVQQNELTPDLIQFFSADDIYLLLNTYSTDNGPELTSSVINRFIQLIGDDVKSDQDFMTDTGAISVGMRILEPHAFSKMLESMTRCLPQFMDAPEVGELQQYCSVYIRKHWNNFSYHDKALSLVCLLNFVDLTPGNQ